MLIHVVRAFKDSINGRNAYRLYTEDVEGSDRGMYRRITTNGRSPVPWQRLENITSGIQGSMLPLSAYYDNS